MCVPRRLAWCAVALVLLNAVNDLVGRPSWMVTRLVYLGGEANLSAWFSSLLLAWAAVEAWRCYRAGKAQAVPRATCFAWCSALLWLMSCDEVAMIHEHVGRYLAGATGVADASFLRHSTAGLVIGPLVLLVVIAGAILGWRVLGRVPPARRRIVWGFGTMLGGGLLVESSINFLDHGRLQWLWNLEILLEEGLEMAGAVLISLGLVLWWSTSGRTGPAPTVARRA